MPPLLALLTLLLAASLPLSAADPCTRVATTPDPDTVDMCAAPFSGAAPPTTSTTVTLVLTLASGTSSLTAATATVNGVDVRASAVDVGGGTYSVSYTTQAGDENWPWAGLAVHMVLQAGSLFVAGFNATLVTGSTWAQTSLPDLDTISARGVCMGDVDSDGDVDVFAARLSPSNVLWINDGGGGFVAKATEWGLAPSTSLAHGCGFADVNGDGMLDLMVTTYSSAVLELYVNRGSVFVEEGRARGFTVGHSSEGLSWGDIDGDGDVDLYVCNSGSDSPNFLFVNNGTGHFTEAAAARGVASPGVTSLQSALADLDNDGDLDLLVAVNGLNSLYVNDGSGHFAEAGAARGLTHSPTSLGFAIADWSGNGALDVYVSSHSSRDLLYVNNGSAVFTEVGAAAGAAASDGVGMGTVFVDADLDGDGDIFVAMGGATSLMWLSSGAQHVTSAAASLGVGVTSGRGVAFADLDGDGDEDAVVSEAGVLLHNPNAQPGVRRSVAIRPLLPSGAQSAFGAGVRLVCVGGCDGVWTALRVIDGGSGFLSQNGYDAVIGVPAPSASYNASVRWVGDVAPAASWGTHPRLGGITPAALPPPSHLFIVRQAPVRVALGVLPWDFAAVTTRSGQLQRAPEPGDMHPVAVTLSPLPDPLEAFTLVSAEVNGRVAGLTWTAESRGVYALAFETVGGDEDWPWAGLGVVVTLADSAGLLSSATLSAVAGSTWGEESGSRGMAAAAASDGVGVCMGDVDNDDDVDVFLVMDGAGNQLWVNDGNGSFADRAVEWGAAGNATAAGRGCAFGDADGDGWVDLVVTRFADNVNDLYMNTGGGFVEDGEGRGVNAGDDSLGVSWGDVDGDDDVDLFICTSTGHLNKLFVNDGAGVFAEEGAGRGVGGAMLSSRQSALVDVDGDGDLDVLVVQSGANELLLNDGAGGFRPGAAGFDGGGNSVGLGVGDWSGDGAVDVYVTNDDRQAFLYVNDGGGVFREVGGEVGVGGPATENRGVSMLDVEGDGDLDVVAGGLFENVVWVNAGGAGFVDGALWLSLGSAASSGGVAVGDVDGDGDVDVVFARSGQVYVNHNARPGLGRSVVIRPLTASGAQSAFGAAVQLECVGGCAAAWVGLRVVDGGSGYFSQGGYDAVFGVPAPSGAYNGSVRWAGGFHPPANWTSHGGLGGIVPLGLASRLFVVRPLPSGLNVGPSPWDRAPPPVPGDVHTLRIMVTPSPHAGDHRVVSAFVSGRNVSGTWAWGGGGAYTLAYETEAGGEDWPWTGVEVAVVVVDSGGLRSSLSTVAVVGSTWSEESDPRGMSEFLDASGRGVCMGDVDGDGDVDVFVAVIAAANQLWLNDGVGNFDNEAVSWGVGNASAHRSFGCGFGDADGDGWVDLVVTSLSADVHELFMNRGGSFVEEGVARGVGVGTNGIGVAWGDVDGDGDVDVHICRNSQLPNFLLSNDGEGVFEDVTAVAGVQLSTLQSRQSLLVDVDGDGDLDLVVVNVGANELFLNNGGGLFTGVGGEHGFSDAAQGVALIAGDWNGDGAVDLYVVNTFTAGLLYVNDGNGVFMEVSRHDLSTTGERSGAAVADFELDGDVDLVLTSYDAGVVLLNGGGLLQEASLGTGLFDGGGASVVFGDVDGDGDVDACVSYLGEVYVNHNARPGLGRSVVIRPLTASGAQSAFGAAVQLECVGGCAAAWVGLRVVDGGSGYFSQGGYDAVFGVPAPSGAYNGSVRWAGGFHPPANWTSHGGLGGIVPLGLASRLFVVRTAAVKLSLGAGLPWDFAAVGGRVGDPSPPVSGDSFTVTITAGAASDLAPLAATVNSQNVVATFTLVSPGEYSLLYITLPGQESWPWTGLHVQVTAVDSGGLVSTLDDVMVPGTTVEEGLDAVGLGGLPGVRGLCLADIDGDGDVDLYASAGSMHVMYINTDGVFVDRTSALGLTAPFNGAGCGAADVNDDGRIDVVVVSFAISQHALLVQQADGVFVDEAATRGLAGSQNARGMGLGDLDGDGDVDMYVCTTSSVNQVLINGGGGEFSEVTSAASSSSFCRAVAVADIDADADLDILVTVGEGAPDELFVNTGGAFASRGSARGFDSTAAAFGIAVGDVSGDGWLDVFVVLESASRDLLFVNSGGGVFVEEGAQRGLDVVAGLGYGVAVVDWDSDGDLDVLIASDGGDVFYMNHGGVLSDRSAALGVVSLSSLYAAVGDFDGDGDVDGLLSQGNKVHLNHNAGHGRANWVVVRPLTAAGAPSAYGALSRLVCVVGCAEREWSAVRAAVSGSGYFSMSGYDLHFGLPVWGVAFDVEVTFVGGATHDKGTDGRLGGVVGGSVVDVVHRPYLEGVAVEYAGEEGGVVGVNDSVVVVLSGGRGWTDLVPGEGCCFVNGVQVVGSFVGGGDGTYNLTYVVGEGDAGWGVAGFTVVPTLMSAGRNVSMVEVVYGVGGGVAGDTVSPVVAFGCRPGAASANVWEEVCVSCPGEESCTFSYSVESTSLELVAAEVDGANYTGGSSARFVVGPFNDTDVATLRVFAVDAGGNTNASEAVVWRVDTSSPVTTLVETPGAVTQRTGATFTLQCSEASCRFAYVFDGGPLTALGGNGTEGGGTGVPVMETVLRVAPRRVSNVTAPRVSFGVNASDAAMLVNATVEVGLGSRRWVLGVVGNETEVLQLPELGDGTYGLQGAGTAGDGVVDVTPVEHVFTVDTRPPVVTVLRAPGDGEAAPEPLVAVGCSEADCVYLWRAGPLPLNSSAWEVSEVGALRPGVVSGVAHGLEVRAVDPAGNVGEAVEVAWVPSGCPPTVPDVFVSAAVDLGVGHRYVAYGGDTETFEYRVDGGAWVATPERDVVLEGVGLGAEHVMEVRAGVPGVCNGRLVGVRPPARSVRWVEPAPLPLEVNIVDAPDAFTPNVFAEFLLVGSRRQAWLEYSLDGEAWAPCAEELVLGPLQAGEHTVRVRAVDGGGGASGAVQSHTWTITAASDSSIVLSGLPDGEHKLTVVATDDAGSVEVDPKTFTWRVDSTPPVVVGNQTSPRFTTSLTAVVEVACTDEIDPCKFCWTSGSVGANCSDASPVTLVAGEDGDHAADVRAVDSVGLVSESGVGVVWTVDSTPPVVTVEDLDGVFVAPLFDTASVDAVVGVAELRLNVTANEAVVGYVVTLNGLEWPAAGAGVVNGPVLEFLDLPSVINEVDVMGVDLSGNVGASTHLSILVDVTPPDATAFTSGLPALTNSSSVVVGVECADSVGASGMRRIVAFVDGVEAGVVEGAAGTVGLTGLGTGVYNVSAVGVDVAGNADDTPVWWVVEVDQVPPESSFVGVFSPYHPSPELTVWALATEEAALYGQAVGVTGWLPANSSGAVTFAGLADGPVVVELRAVDVAGNAERWPYAGVGLTVDTTPPVLFWVEPPQVFTADPVAVGCFAVNDSTAVSFAVWPLAASLPSETCFRVLVAEDGRAGVNVTGTDAAGNVGGVLTVEWVLDRVAPVAVVDAAVKDSGGCVHVDGGDTVCNAVGGAEVEVSCSDGGVGVEVSPCRVQYVVVLEEAAVGSGCEVEGGRRLAAGFEDAPGGAFVLEGGEGDGLYAVAVRGVDEAGNVEAGNVTLRWYVDTVVPVRPVFVQQPGDVVLTGSVLFVVQLEGDTSPGQSVFWYRLDEGVVAAVEDLPVDVDDDVQLEFDGLSPGNHKVEVWAVDQGGNVGPSVLHNWEVVTEAPGVVILEQPAAVSGDITPSFVFAARWGDRPAGNASEPSAGVEVSLNGAAEYVEVCANTVESGGVCVWNASLAETGVGAYTINVRASLVGNVGDPTPFAWQYTVCGDDAFAELGADGGISCVGCPVGGNCAGGLTGQADIAAVQGFWAPEGSTGLRFYECPVEEACLPGGEVVVGNATVRVVGQCAEGYKGTLCAVCEDGFFEQFGLCVSCGTESGVAWLIMFAVAVGVIGVGVLFFRFRDLMPIDQLKVTLSMVQIIASANTAYAIPWPPLFADFLNTTRVFLIEAVSLTRANCAQPMTFYGSLVVTLVGFKVVLAVVVVGPVVWHKLKRGGGGGGMAALQPRPQGQPVVAGGRQRRRSSVVQAMVAGAHLVQAVDWAKIFKITFLFLFVAYPGVSLKIMSIFKCVEVEGEHWLVADMRLKCYEGDWFGYALYAFVMGCLYTGGLPLAITVILWRNRRKLGEEGVVAKWGFLYESYGVGAYLWEVVELLRKLWLSALVVLMAEGSPLQVTVAVLISGWAHVVHALYKPWRGVGEGGSSVYALQHGSLFVTFVVFLMGLLFKVEGVSQDGDTYNFLAWVMLLACVGFLTAAVLVLVTAVTAQLRKSRAKALLAGRRSSDRRTTRDAVDAWSGGALPAPTDDSSLGSRTGAVPRAVRASRMGGAQAVQMAWVGNPLKAVKGGAGDKGTPTE